MLAAQYLYTLILQKVVCVCACAHTHTCVLIYSDG